MIWIGLVLAIQIATAIHIVRSRANQMWIMLVLALPLAGSAAYFIIEVLPKLQGNRHVRTVRAKAEARLDPERDVRAACERLALTDSAQNRIDLGDALAALDRHGEALPYYREALGRIPGGDDRVRVKLARALLESGRIEEAEALIGDVAEPRSIGERDRLAMLRARIFEAQDRIGEALALYEDLATRWPGEEARCRLAALLIETGQRERAKGVLEEVERRAKRLDRQQRAAEADMYDWAAERLAELRAG